MCFLTHDHALMRAQHTSKTYTQSAWVGFECNESRCAHIAHMFRALLQCAKSTIGMDWYAHSGWVYEGEGGTHYDWIIPSEKIIFMQNVILKTTDVCFKFHALFASIANRLYLAESES